MIHTVRRGVGRWPLEDRVNMLTDSDEGIDFRAYDCPDDDPIGDSSFEMVAEGVQKLITKYDFAFSRLQESVKECDDRCKRQVVAEVKWRRRREKYAQWATTRHRLLDKAAGPPGPQFRFEVCPPDIHVWFPWKFWSRNRPKVVWPLPLRDGEMERWEKETILAVVYDCCMKGGRRIADGLDLEHYDRLAGTESPGGRQGGLVKQVPAKHLRHLERWLKQFEKDLQFLAAKGVSGVQGGRAAPASAASKTGQGETPPAEAESKQVAWSDDDAVFMPNKEAVTLSKGKISLSALSKLLTPTGSIRHMRMGRRCKVHFGDFNRHLRTMAGGLSDNEVSDIADGLFGDIEERRAAEQKKKKEKEAGK